MKRKPYLLQGYSLSPSTVSSIANLELFYQELSSSNEELNSIHVGDVSYTLNDFNLFQADIFDITLVTYTSVQSSRFLSSYKSHWAGPIVVVVYYSQAEKELMKSVVTEIRSLSDNDAIPINTLKNRGIDAVSTTHFLFAEFDLIPSNNLYNVLKTTPGYLWRDPYFIGVIPAYEWAHHNYSEAEASWMNMNKIPPGGKSLETCMRNYHCRPIQTTTIPMQFRTFSYTHYRNMNCIDNDTEVYMVMRKTELLPRYSESVVERGYDNIEFVERLRFSSAKFGMLCKEFLFRVPGIGMDSDEIFRRLSDPALRAQYDAIREEHIKNVKSLNPTTSCNIVEGAMYSWIGFEKYEWMPEQEVNGVVYPKIAVKRGKSVSLIV